MSALHGVYDEIVDKIGTSKARLVLLEILKKEGNPDKMIKACRKALEFLPDDSTIRKLLAETYFEQGSLQFAEIELDKLSKQIDELSLIYKLKSELYKKNNKIEEAIHALKLYLAHHANDQDAAHLLSELNTSSEKQPSILPTSTLAELYYKQGELEEAISIYEHVVQDSPDDEKSKKRLDELKAIGETEENRKTYEEKQNQKKLRLIEILEQWLIGIKQRNMVHL